MPVPEKDGKQIIGAQAHGHQILGNNFSAGGNNIININNNNAPSDERKRCLVALFTTNPEDDRAKYLSFKGEVIDTAFQWILDSSIYQEWLQTSSGSQLLWICGGPGMGKTMLSIFLSNELGKIPNCRVLYYFCESRDPKRNTPVSLLRGLIYSLIRQRPALMNYLLPDYEVQQDALFGQDSIEALWRIFIQMIGDPDTGTVYCVIDALDECQADLEHLEHILKKFRRYFADSDLSDRLGRASLKSGSLKLALISREAPHCLTSELSPFSRIPLQTPTAEGDGGKSEVTKLNFESKSLQIYMDAKLDELGLSHGYNEHTKELLRQTLRQRGDGTFLWVDMAIAQLSKTTAADPLQTNFPDGAVGMYSLTLLQLPEKSIKLAKTILGWVTVAFQSLKLAEIHALGNVIYGQDDWIKLRNRDEAGSPTNNQNDNDYPDLRRVIASCKNLLDINADGEVKLVHETAKAFLVDFDSPLLSDARLVDFHVDEAAIHGDVAQASISYLEKSPYTEKWIHLITIDEDPHSHKKIEANHDALKANPLLLYASVHWPAHLRHARRGLVNFDSPFFNLKDRTLLQNWWDSNWGYMYRRDAEDAAARETLLHVAAFFDLVEIADYLSQRSDFSKLMDAYNSEFDPPSVLAARQGSVKVMEVFLNHGAKRSYLGKPFLHVAGRRGHLQLVKMLIERGESPNTADSTNTMVKKGAMGVLRHIPETWLNRYLTIFEDHDDVERISLARLNYGASVTVLQSAASAAQVEVARFLIQEGADVHAATATGWTAVHFAGYAGRPVMIDLLVEHQAKLDALTVDGWGALHIAAWNGKVAGVSCLLDHGLDVDSTDKKGDTPLHLAVDRGHVDVARILVGRGAKVDRKNKKGLTLLQRAIAKGDADMMRLLEESKGS